MSGTGAIYLIDRQIGNEIHLTGCCEWTYSSEWFG